MYNEALTWIENALDSLHETGKMGSLYWRATYTEEDHKALKLLFPSRHCKERREVRWRLGYNLCDCCRRGTLRGIR